MKIQLALLAASLIALQASAETAGEKRWRLRAEILERELELTRMELAEQKQAAPPAQQANAPTTELLPFVDRHGVRLPDTDVNDVSMATLAPTTLVQAEDGTSGGGAAAGSTGATSLSTAEVEEKYDRAQYIKDLRKFRTVDKEHPPVERDLILSYQMLKPSTRVFFDTGNEDADEPDLFKNGNFGASVDLLTVRADFYLTESISLGAFVGGGLAAATENTFNAAVVAWNAGISLSAEDIPVAVEFGFMQGITANEDFDDKLDSALFVGLTTNPAIASHRIRVRSTYYDRPDAKLFKNSLKRTGGR